MKPTMSMFATRAEYEKALEKWLDDQAGVPEDFYDEDGNLSEGGIYDAGGHMIDDRIADFVDFVEYNEDR